MSLREASALQGHEAPHVVSMLELGYWTMRRQMLSGPELRYVPML